MRGMSDFIHELAMAIGYVVIVASTLLGVLHASCWITWRLMKRMGWLVKFVLYCRNRKQIDKWLAKNAPRH